MCPAENGRRYRGSGTPGQPSCSPQGLGHRAIMRDAAVVRLAVDFIGEQVPR